MDSDAILSFSTPLKTTERIEVSPSPVLELIYAAIFFGSPRRRHDKDVELPWVSQVKREHADLLAELASFWADDANERSTGFELFVAACQLGYARDASPQRFLSELPELPGRFLKLNAKSASEEAQQETFAWLLRRFEALAKPERMAHYQPLFTRLWDALQPYWREEGQEVVTRESKRFQGVLDEGKGVLQALPKHYFARSEKLAEQVRQFAESGWVVVVPLYFSVGGGFALDTDNALYIGYGLHSESQFQKLATQSEGLAQRLKAFADPTRLLVLTMLGHYEVTVGDLAGQLDVSQPTISGHLKLLRKAGLVEVEKKGNKAFYKVRKEAVRALLAEVSELLTIP